MNVRHLQNSPNWRERPKLHILVFSKTTVVWPWGFIPVAAKTENPDSIRSLFFRKYYQYRFEWICWRTSTQRNRVTVTLEILRGLNKSRRNFVTSLIPAWVFSTSIKQGEWKLRELRGQVGKVKYLFGCETECLNIWVFSKQRTPSASSSRSTPAGTEFMYFF